MAKSKEKALMSTQIRGYVEGREPRWLDWHAIIDTHMLLGNNYALFALLFGVRNDEGTYTPVAARRGFPRDLSETVKYAKDGRRLSYTPQAPSWISYEEIAAIDWKREPYKDALSEDWQVLFDMMGRLNSFYCRYARDEKRACVRLVVWFDQT